MKVCGEALIVREYLRIKRAVGNSSYLVAEFLLIWLLKIKRKIQGKISLVLIST